ncbi:MAG: CAP domain-containing protein, partial [Actinomycetota bacterium]
IYHNQNLGSDVKGNWTMVGENVGVGPDVATLHQAFIDSPEHRDNILERSYNQIGVGVAYGADGNIYVTEDFAARTTSGTVTHHTTTTVRRTMTSRPVTHHVTTRSVTPVARPAAPPAAVAVADPRTVDMLVRMIGMDADSVNPQTGEATDL